MDRVRILYKERFYRGHVRKKSVGSKINKKAKKCEIKVVMCGYEYGGE